MKFTILQQDFLSILQSVSRSTGIKTNLPILANVLIQTEKPFIKLSSTNLEIGIIEKINAEIEEEGALSVPAKMFLEIISSLPSTKITLESLDQQLKIETLNFKATLNGINASEFPVIPLSFEQTFSIDSKILKESLPKITFAAATDEGRPVLTGVLTELKKNSLELVATDGFRLALKKVKIIGKGEFRSLIPRKTFEEIIKLIDENENTKEIKISITENQNQMVFQIGNTELSSRLIEGQFPAWEKIIPTSYINKTTVDRGQFLKSIKLASVFARDLASVIKIKVEQNNLNISSSIKELGEQNTNLEAQTEGEGLIIAFNAKFLLEALSSCSSKEVVVEFSGDLSPAIIKPLEEEGLKYIIMPVRLS